MKLRMFALVVFISLAIVIACGSEEEGNELLTEGSPAPGSGMLIEMSMQGAAVFGQPLHVSFTYQVDAESGWPTPDTLVASSYIESLWPNFELLAGDSAWVDTLFVGDTDRTHSFVIRPLVRGATYNCVLVGAYLYDGLSIGANECLLIDAQ